MEIEAESGMTPRVRTNSDEIESVLNDLGSGVPELTRLRDLACRIEELEWALARRKAASDSGRST